VIRSIGPPPGAREAGPVRRPFPAQWCHGHDHDL